MVQALVPLNDLVKAKTRLSGLLRPSERRALAQAMVEDVLGVLQQHPRVRRVVLVSDDPGAHLLAERYGAVHWSEQQLGVSGLNAVVAAATQKMLAQSAGTLLVLHGDLPLLSAADIDAVLASQGETGGVTVGCDKNRTGTNLLAFSAWPDADFCFGPESCSAHLRLLEQAGIPAQVIYRDGIACDVDEPEDLADLLGSQGRCGEHTRTFLERDDLAVRIRLALETLSLSSRGAPDLPGEVGP